LRFAITFAISIAMRFEFATAGRILFGRDAARQAGALAKNLASRALVVTGADTARAQFLLDSLRENAVSFEVYPVAGEPGLDTVRQGAALARGAHCGLVVGIGGGSALDAGKAMAAMLANPGDVLDYLEIIGGGKSLTEPSAPFIAIPTTAGTGSEVTRNAVLASPEHRVKVSLRSSLMLARIALVDPDLTTSLPPAVTASTGLDALTQLIEPYVCRNAGPMTDGLCVEGLRRARSLRAAFDNGRDAAAREDMTVASLFGGLALANAGLGAVHGFAGAIGGMFRAPHGAVCAALLPFVMEANLSALRRREPRNEAVRRYEEAARLLTGQPAANADEGIEWVRRLVHDLQIPPLRVYGFDRPAIPEVMQKAANASSMKANPIILSADELAAILQRAI
jgi:alcohol dehydrogenase class IV